MNGSISNQCVTDQTCKQIKNDEEENMIDIQKSKQKRHGNTVPLDDNFTNLTADNISHTSTSSHIDTSSNIDSSTLSKIDTDTSSHDEETHLLSKQDTSDTKPPSTVNLPGKQSNISPLPPRQDQGTQHEVNTNPLFQSQTKQKCDCLIHVSNNGDVGVESTDNETNNVINECSNKKNKSCCTCLCFQNVKKYTPYVITFIICVVTVIILYFFLPREHNHPHDNHHKLNCSNDINPMAQRVHVLPLPTIQTVSLHIRWKHINGVDASQILNLTWVQPHETFIALEENGAKLYIQSSGIYTVHLSFNLQTRSTRRDSIVRQRFSSLICMRYNRYREIMVENTAMTVSILDVKELSQGDFIWISMLGVNYLYRTDAGNYLTIIKQ